MKIRDIDRTNTINKLTEIGIPVKTAEEIVDSGYIYSDAMQAQSCAGKPSENCCLLDTFYGKYISLEQILGNPPASMQSVSTIWVSSLAEANEAIAEYTKPLNPEWFLTYRGMNTEYYLKRKYSNPFSPKVDGKEPSLLPSYWRKYDYDDDNINFEEQFFRILPGQELVYDGIDIKALKKKNTDKYGAHTISDLEDDDDPINQEFYRRWQARMNGAYEAALLAQHYGLCTRFLDITFDLGVGLFFAAYKYTKNENGKGTYKLNINSDAAVYCFNFGHDFFREDEYLKSSLFAHAFPERPKRQKCVGYSVGYYECNYPANHIVYRIKLKDNFDISGLRRPEELFPPRQEDPFYDLLLRYKEKHKDSKQAEEIIEYEF